MLAEGDSQFSLPLWAISIAIPAASGLLGVVLGSWLTWKREHRQLKLSFAERQLKEFYAPMIAKFMKIRSRSEVNQQISTVTDEEWKKLCARYEGVGALENLSKTRSEEFCKYIDYNNKQFNEEIIPAYREMERLFLDKLWLADPETQSHYQSLCRFNELWNRAIQSPLPMEVSKKLWGESDPLRPLYDDLRKMHDELRKKIQNGKA